MNIFKSVWDTFLFVLQEIKTLIHIIFVPIQGQTHQERLESFYKLQAKYYDSFRKKLLHGREELIQNLEPKGVWIDMGGGTGANVEFMASLNKLKEFKKVYIVDLSPSLLEVAKDRIRQNNWKNVETVCADATTFQPKEEADLVTFSYSLTMIPDWFLALENAHRFLKEKGTIGIVDFYISRKYPGKDIVGNTLKKHNWFLRTFWQLWFGFDNVNLNPDHLPYMLNHYSTELLREKFSKVPYIPLIQVPFYIFIGTKIPKKTQ